ncbi:UNVERIFIED_CONTAM: hypothetical protein K2H54_059588 [Gekko kuhli]
MALAREAPSQDTVKHGQLQQNSNAQTSPSQTHHTQTAQEERSLDSNALGLATGGHSQDARILTGSNSGSTRPMSGGHAHDSMAPANTSHGDIGPGASTGVLERSVWVEASGVTPGYLQQLGSPWVGLAAGRPQEAFSSPGLPAVMDTWVGLVKQGYIGVG